jgi:hypothetical protein
MIALFEGEPQMVILEEPHHGVQFGVRPGPQGLTVPLRDPQGNQVLQNEQAIPVTVPTRQQHSDVVRVAALRNALNDARATHPQAIEQTGSASFAISVLDPPWRQHFQGTEDHAGDQPPPSRPYLQVAQVVQEPAVLTSVKLILGVS